jgi:hypothetical protein
MMSHRGAEVECCDVPILAGTVSLVDCLCSFARYQCLPSLANRPGEH